METQTVEGALGGIEITHSANGERVNIRVIGEQGSFSLSMDTTEANYWTDAFNAIPGVPTYQTTRDDIVCEITCIGDVYEVVGYAPESAPFEHERIRAEFTYEQADKICGFLIKRDSGI